MPAPEISLVIERLREKHPDAKYELNWTTPLELLVATTLAAQCTDERVNRITEALFKKYTSAQAYLDVPAEELEEDIRASGTYKQKAKSIRGACQALVDRFGGEVPETMEELITLPGIARKSANVVLNTAFNIASGIIVDTHVARVSPRMGLTKQTKPEDIERDLMKKVPQDQWTFFGPAMVLHGRYTCVARGPKCGECIFDDVCPKIGVLGPPTPLKKTLARGVMKIPELPPSWQAALSEEFSKPYFKDLAKFVDGERKANEVFPPEDEVFSALQLTPYDQVRVLLLGQDPYHDNNQAHGLCFSVKPGIRPPPSLVNMYKELESDLGIKAPKHGYLTAWAKQGMLMINAVLTVRAHTPNSHKDKGWEQFTDAVIKKVNEKTDPVVFLLWGGYAKKKAKLITGKHHVVIQGTHPSPLSANSGFFGSKPYSGINEALKSKGKPPIDWELPAEVSLRRTHPGLKSGARGNPMKRPSKPCWRQGSFAASGFAKLAQKTKPAGAWPRRGAGLARRCGSIPRGTKWLPRAPDFSPGSVAFCPIRPGRFVS